MKLQVGGNYFSPYLKGFVTLKAVKEDYVIFWHNPGTVGNWFWKTSINNFEENFNTKKPEAFKEGMIAGISAVQVDENYNVIKHIRGRKFN